jgi:hypothetical protein
VRGLSSRAPAVFDLEIAWDTLLDCPKQLFDCCFLVFPEWFGQTMKSFRNAAKTVGFAPLSFDNLYLVPDAKTVAISTLSPRLASELSERPKVCVFFLR